MAFDGMMTYAIAEELDAQLHTGKITKIYQPYEREIVFHIRAQGNNYKLLLSANPTYPRIHLTQENYSNPPAAPMFCMVLRKHLEGGVIEGIKQVNMERIIHIDIRSRNELGDIHSKRVIIEIMGRHSNMILIDPEQNMIIDSIHHVTPAINQYRVLLPGKEYVHPPEQHKLHPFQIDQETFIKKINFNQGKIDQQLVQQFSGISPLLAKEILFQAGLPNRDNLFKSFKTFMETIQHRKFKPTIITTEKKEFFYLFPLTHFQGKEQHFPNISTLLEAFFHGKAERDQVKQQAADLFKFISNEKQKNEKKIGKLEKELAENEQAEKYKLYGELLTAYMHQIKRGDQSIEVINYYDEQESTVRIPLEADLTPNENAQAYFKKYNKAKKSVYVMKEQIKLAQAEVAYFDTLLQQLEIASPKDINEIREELIEGKYLRDRSKKQQKKKKEEKPKPDTYLSSEGIELLVGKNNKQNDYLTNRLGRANETWLHTKDIPGSHVLIRSTSFSEQTLQEAAQLAAYFSKARQSSQVPVDYTLIKHVKKPSGAKLGYVIYEQQKTIFVTPSEEVIQSLKRI